VTGGRGEEAEASIFVDDPRGLFRAPAVLAREPILKRQRRRFRADRIMAEGHPYRVIVSGLTIRLAHLI
jgi:hypothetical protein